MSSQITDKDKKEPYPESLRGIWSQTIITEATDVSRKLGDMIFTTVYSHGTLNNNKYKETIAELDSEFVNTFFSTLRSYLEILSAQGTIPVSLVKLHVNLVDYLDIIIQKTAENVDMSLDLDEPKYKSVEPIIKI